MIALLLTASLISAGSLDSLDACLQEMQEEIREKDHEIIRLKGRMKKIRSRQDEKVKKDAEIAKRDVIIQNLKKNLRKEERRTKNLKKKLDRLRKFEEAPPDAAAIPAKILAMLTREGVWTLQEDMGIRKDDLVYVHRTDGWGRSVLKELGETGVRAVVAGCMPENEPDPALIEATRDLGLPLLLVRPGEVETRGKIAYIARDLLEDAFEEWEEGQREYDREKKARMVEHIFKEYRTERGREMRKVG